MRDDMKKELCIDTFINTIKHYDIHGGILHSDQGSQYIGEEFQTALSEAGVTQSLSGENHCYDNFRMESLFATLKKEMLYRITTYKMKRDDVKSIIFRYVFIYYNRRRVYTSNPEWIHPVVYRRLYEEESPLAA